MLKGFRNKVKSFFLGTRDGKPVIETEFGPVSEEARWQAAINMRNDGAVKQRVESALCKMYGIEKGLQEARKRYPECYEDRYGK